MFRTTGCSIWQFIRKFEIFIRKFEYLNLTPKLGFNWPIDVFGLYIIYSASSYLQKTSHDHSTETCTYSITESFESEIL